MESIEIMLNNNSFQFNNINYIQNLGTAMGTKMAPTYATLTLAYLEENLHEIIGKNLATTWKKNLPNHGKDIWMIASYSGNAHGVTSTNHTTYYKTYTPK